MGLGKVAGKESVVDASNRSNPPTDVDENFSVAFPTSLLISLVALAFITGASLVLLVTTLAGAITTQAYLPALAATLCSGGLTILNAWILMAWGEQVEKTFSKTLSNPSER